MEESTTKDWHAQSANFTVECAKGVYKKVARTLKKLTKNNKIQRYL